MPRLLRKLPTFRSLCEPVGAPIGLVQLLFNPIVESRDLLVRWGAYRGIRPKKELVHLSKETLEELAKRDMVRHSNMPAIAGFTDFESAKVSTEFLRIWLSWYGIQPGTLDQSQRSWLEKTVTSLQGEARRPEQSQASALRVLHRAQRSRDRVLAALQQLGDCVLDQMEPRLFQIVEQRLSGHRRKSLKGTVAGAAAPLPEAGGEKEAPAAVSLNRELRDVLALSTAGLVFSMTLGVVMDDKADRTKAAMVALKRDDSSGWIDTFSRNAKLSMLDYQHTFLRTVGGYLPLLMYTRAGMIMMSTALKFERTRDMLQTFKPWLENMAPSLYIQILRVERMGVPPQLRRIITSALSDIIGASVKQGTADVGPPAAMRRKPSSDNSAMMM